MSIHLMTAAWRIDMPASKKLVLLALCDWANDDGASLHPSIARIAERASMSERNAQRVMHDLIADGWLAVVGNHNGGKPGTSRQYQLNAPAIYSGAPPANPAETGDAGVTGDKLSRVTNQAQNGGRRVTNPAETGDTGVTLTVIDPSIKATVSKGAQARARPTTVERPDDVSEDVWRDWLTLRRAKKAPVTATVLKGARQEAEKAQMPLEAFLEIWCQRGSQGLKAEWLATDKTPQIPGKPYANRSELDPVPFHQLSLADQCAARNRARRAERERAAAIEAESFQRLA